MGRPRSWLAASLAALAGIACSAARAADDPFDPKESRNFMIRKLPYITLYEQGIARHLATFKAYPPRRIVGMANL